MASDNVYGTLYNADSTAISPGMLIRISANRQGVRAQANSSANVQGLAGLNISGIVGIGGPMNVASAAFGVKVLLETGLTPAAGQTLYISASVAGRATNVAPATAVAVGTIDDVGSYTTNQYVLATISVPAGVAGGGGVFPGYGVGVAGPTAVGSEGAATTVRRSDQTAAAYRSDLPLATTWFIDPVNGSDASTNPGTTSATALRSRDELFRRWWGAVITSNTTVTILGSLSSQTVVPFFKPAPGVIVTFQGSLGPTTGFGGAAIDNTLFSGTVTGFVAAANVPTADDIEMTDSAIPVSFTASGGLAAGVIYRRNSGGSVQHWYALADLGAKTIQITSPMNNAGVATWGTLNNGDGYAAYAMWQWPTCDFGDASNAILTDSLNEQSTQNENVQGRAPRRRRVWLAATTNIRTIGNIAGWVNCLLECTSAAQTVATNFSGTTSSSWIGGGGRGTGSTVTSVFGKCVFLGCNVFRGMALSGNDTSQLYFEQQIAFQSVSVACLQGVNNSFLGCVSANANSGVSGKGNTGKLLTLAQGAQFGYQSASAAPPFVAASTTDANPITIRGVNYTVAQLPAVIETILNSALPFPFGPTALANGAVACVMTANVGPTGANTAIQRWVQVPDGAGGFYTFPSWT